MTLQRQTVSFSNNQSILAYKDTETGTILLPANLDQYYQQNISSSSSSFSVNIPFSIKGQIRLEVFDDSVSSDPGDVNIYADINLDPFTINRKFPMNILGFHYDSGPGHFVVACRTDIVLPKSLVDNATGDPFSVAVSGFSVSSVEGVLEGKKIVMDG